MNNLNLASALLFEPRKAFAEIDARPRFWFPLLLLIAAAVITAVWYQSVVDIEWVTDRAIRSSSFASRLTEAQIEEAIKRQTANPAVGTVIAVVATSVLILLVGLIGTLYMMLAGKITNVQRSFRQWFSLTWWTALPGVLSALGAAFVLLTANTSQIDQGELKPLSLNALFFQRAFNEPGYTLLSSIDLIQLFCLFLLVTGVRAWSGRSWLFSCIFALAPYALLYGIWAFVSLR